jgi:general secretion pathway protein M
MIAALTLWWQGRSPREQALLGGMLALLTLCTAWFGIWDPAQSARISAEERLERAVIARDGAAGRIAWLKINAAVPPAGTPLADLVTGSANDTGFVLVRSQSAGENRLTIEIASARAPALFAWLAVLDRQGVFVESADLVPKSDGALAATLTLRKAS